MFLKAKKAMFLKARKVHQYEYVGIFSELSDNEKQFYSKGDENRN